MIHMLEEIQGIFLSLHEAAVIDIFCFFDQLAQAFYPWYDKRLLSFYSIIKINYI